MHTRSTNFCVAGCIRSARRLPQGLRRTARGGIVDEATLYHALKEGVYPLRLFHPAG